MALARVHAPGPVVGSGKAPGGKQMKKRNGFTLIELMIVLAVVAILAAIAIPAFTQQIRKSRRAEAMKTLADLQLRQERWRASNATYTNTLSNLGFTSSALPSGYYTVAASTPGNVTGCTCTTANCYAFTATTAGTQVKDSKCATLVWSNRCGTVTKTSTPSGNTCW